MPELQQLPISAPTDDILEIVERDGAIILTDALSRSDLETLRGELEPYMAATGDGRDDFSGRATTRTGALVARSPTTRNMVTDPRVPNPLPKSSK